MSLTVTTHSPDETVRLGEVLGRLLRAGDVVLLQGDLGAGKTRLTQGVVRGAGGVGPVTSPTFVFVNVYRGPLTCYHVDLYRIEQPSDADTLGLEDYLEGGGVTVVEWPERAPHALPAEHLAVHLQHAGDQDRTLTFTGRGSRYRGLVTKLRAALAGGPV